MDVTQRDTLRELLRRVEEVRGLSGTPSAQSAMDPDDPEVLLHTLSDLADELERSHRRLIETNVQLVSLREVASSMVGAEDAAETTRLVTRYLCRAFGFQEAVLMLVNRESATLQGTWTHLQGDKEQSFTLEVPLTGDSGTLSRALWMNRAMIQHATRARLRSMVPDGHPLVDILESVAYVAAAPLQRSHAVLPQTEPHELCGAPCILGDPMVLAPRPGPAAENWTREREDRQRTCLSCDLMPILGVIGMARRTGSAPVNQGDVMMLESIGHSLAPMVENARLYQDLRRSERFREHVLDSMASALVAVNMKGEILTFNHAAEELLKVTEAEVAGQPIGAVLGTDGEALLRDALEDGRESLRVETHLRARDGTPIPVRLTTSLLRNDRRAVYGAIATFTDLTPLKRAEEHARQLDRLAALGRFTSSVAHELRNPLTCIATGVQYLARAIPADSPERTNLQFILDEMRRLDRIIQELFDVTHPRRLHFEVAPIEECVTRARHSLDGVLEAAGVTYKLEVTPRTPPVPHDTDQMQQVFINLIKNAAEATPAGGRIVVRIEPAARAAERGPAGAAPMAVAVHVEDSGSGIAPEHQGTLFEPFFTTKKGGTGLGLYISHDIVKRHGGSLTVQSEPGRGTRFSVELPLETHGGTP